MSVEGSTPELAEVTIRNSVFFDADFYRNAYPDVASSGMDPALHYLLHGALEGRNPGPNFSTKEYLDQNPCVAASGINALVHYELSGREEGRLPFCVKELAEQLTKSGSSKVGKEASTNGPMLLQLLEPICGHSRVSSISAAVVGERCAGWQQVRFPLND
jgi:hypothetical protein